MVTPAEALPDDFDDDERLEPGVLAHMGRIPLAFAYEEEVSEIPHSGSAHIILHAYMLNRFDHEAQNPNIRIHQHLLRAYRVGQFITKALDEVYELDRASIIDPALISPLRETDETHITHAILIQEALPYLPSGVGPEAFQDLRLDEDKVE